MTGSRRGIGRAIALHLGRAGFDVVLNGLGDAASVADLLAELGAAGVDGHYVPADVASRDGRAALITSARERFGRLHLLVNNAGVAPDVRADILDATEESYERVMRVNLQGPYFLTQSVARWMIEQRSAGDAGPYAIVNIGSMSAEAASVARGEYCISKAGVGMATRLWAVRLAEHGIGVYEIRPGLIRTDMTAGVAAKYDALIAEGVVPERRWGTPDDVGAAVGMLARGELPYATGQILHLDGGLLLPRL